jgi:hypothetical protein
VGDLYADKLEPLWEEFISEEDLNTFLTYANNTRESWLADLETMADDIYSGQLIGIGEIDYFYTIDELWARLNEKTGNLNVWFNNWEIDFNIANASRRYPPWFR